MSLDRYLRQLRRPEPLSHKGQNGKALIVGGSDLFHAASQWSFKASSRLTDMTFYSSVAENNELVRDAKFYGSDGVVVRRGDLSSYLDEVDAVLIGPGMRRDTVSRFTAEELERVTAEELSTDDWEHDSLAVTSVLLHGWPEKRWVIDAGSLQVMQPAWTPAEAILTPHAGELRVLAEKLPGGIPDWLDELTQRQTELAASVQAQSGGEFSLPASVWNEELGGWFGGEVSRQMHEFSTHLNRSVILLKGAVDIIWNEREVVVVAGGNPGLTKGGTGDVLAGVSLGLRATSPALASAVVASWLNKQAGHELYLRQAEMFNASDLADMIPQVWRNLTF